MFSEIIKMCCIQWYNSYLTNNNGKYTQNRQHILYIPYNSMGIIVMSTTLLLHHLFCRNPNESTTQQHNLPQPALPLPLPSSTYFNLLQPTLPYPQVMRSLSSVEACVTHVQQSWQSKKHRLEQCLQLRMLEQDVEKVGFVVTGVGCREGGLCCYWSRV